MVSETRSPLRRQEDHGTTKTLSKRCYVFVTLLCAATLSAPVLARQDGKPVVAFLAFEPGGCKNAAFHRGMKELNYEDGKNMVFACRHAQGRYELLDSTVVELMKEKPDLLVVFGHAPGQAAQRARSS